ncbi:MAG: type IV toxin-antitoxin system AbiEi family antitoxin domain-containing protein [Pseudonocardia sp.]
MEPVREGPLLRARLLASGYRDEELRRMQSDGALVALRPGAYVPSTDARLRDPATRHALLVQAVVQQLSPGAAVSHVSAAVLHGLPLWEAPLDRVHVTRDRRSGGRRSRLLHLHAAALDADEIVMASGVAVTSVARTLVDLARVLPFEPAVVPVDAALHRGVVDRADLDDAVERARSRRGNSAARRVVAFADGRSESVGESRSRVAIARCVLPVPVPQWEVRSDAGVLLGRVDFGWPELSTVGEFDGRVKYGRLLRPGETAGDAVFREKRREDDIRDAGERFVRWVWDDLDRFDRVAQRLRRAFGTP